MRNRTSKTAARTLNHVACEALEQRRLLCGIYNTTPTPKWSDIIEQNFQAEHAARGGPEAVGIVWSNRNTFSGTNDNGFDEAFGTSAGAAQAVVDAALNAWSRVITSFNRADGTSTLQLNISIAKDGGGNVL